MEITEEEIIMGMIKHDPTVQMLPKRIYKVELTIIIDDDKPTESLKIDEKKGRGE